MILQLGFAGTAGMFVKQTQDPLSTASRSLLWFVPKVVERDSDFGKMVWLDLQWL